MPGNQSDFRKTIAVNTTAQIIARVISAGVTFIIALVIANRYGAAGFGDFVKITTYIAFFYLLADFGLNAVFLQRHPADSDISGDTAHGAWEDLLALRLLVSCVLTAGACLLLFVLPRSDSQGYTALVRIGIVLFAPTILFTALTTSANALFQKYLRYDLSTVAVTAGSLASLVLVLATTLPQLVDTNILLVTTSLLIGSAVTSFTGLLLTRRLHITRHTHLSPGRMKSLLVAGVPLGLTLLFNLVYFRIDSIILTLTRTTQEVGVYGFAYKVFEIPLVLPTFFMNALYPIMLAVAADKEEQIRNSFRRLVARSAAFLFLAACLLSLMLWFGAPLISFVRSDFVPGIPALRVLAYGLPFFFLSSITMWILITYKRQKILAVMYGVTMLLNVGLNMAFIPVYGYMAAAWTTVVSEAFVLLLSGVVVLRILNLKSLPAGRQIKS
jgi:O-antigen/teichoic acid export membrane protein